MVEATPAAATQSPLMANMMRTQVIDAGLALEFVALDDVADMASSCSEETR